MNKSGFLIYMLFIPIIISAQGIFGKWKTIDGQTGEEKSIVEIYEDDGKVFGKIVDILNPSQKNVLCIKCDGIEKNKPVMGLVIIKNMQKEDDYYNDGTIFHPEHGKTLDAS